MSTPFSTNTRAAPLDTLTWAKRVRVLPEFLGYPPSAFAVVMLLVLFATLMEGTGIALVYPILEIMQSSGDLENLAERSTVFRYTTAAFDFVGLSVTLETMLLVTASSVVVRQVLTYAVTVVRTHFVQRSVEHVSSRTFRLFASAGIPYAERLRSGTLVNALLTEAKRTAMFAQALQNAASALLKAVVYVTLLVFVSWKATAFAILVLIVISLVVSRGSIRGSKLSGRLINSANDRLTRYISERFALFRLMKIQGTASVEGRLYAEEVRRLRDLNVDVARRGARIRTLIEGITVLGGLALVYLTVAMIALPLPVLGIFLLVLFRLLPVAQEISVSRQLLAANLQSIYYVDRICLEAQAAAEVDTGTRAFPGLTKSIRFEGVSFAYPPSDDGGRPVPALHDINLTIPAGRTTALLGPSGAGKSTLIDFIPRLRAPTAGRILFDDVLADDIRLADLRASVAMVSQDTLIIDGTVTENLRYGQPDATEDQVVAAAQAAFADGFIRNLPKGYDTVVGERGVLLSGGQKQRIALARALLANVPILLLDEPTSALDAESEQAVQRALETLQAGNDMTIIIIAHRLSTVRHADQIVVLENGRLLGVGTHDSLIESAGWYRKIVELQTGEHVPAPDGVVPAIAGRARRLTEGSGGA